MKPIHLLTIVCLPLLLSACTGSAYQLPTVSHAEKMQAEEEIKTDTSELRTYKRSDSNYKNRIARITKRLQKSAQPLCEHAEYASCVFEVEYSNEDIENAYAYEDNKIVVFKGFLKYLKNDHEMAALVGHEMGHHLADHIEEKRRNAETGAAVSGVLTAVLIGVANANNPYYNSYQQQQDQQTIENMMAAGYKIGEISFSKEQEREADLLSAYLLEHAGYNLDKAQSLLYVMSRLSGDEVPGHAALLSSHPPSSERVVAWRKAIEEIEVNETKLPYPKQP